MATTVAAVGTDNTQQSTKSGSERCGGGSGSSNMRTMAAITVADGTITVLAATTRTAAVVARGSDVCGRVFWRRRVVAEGRKKIAKAIW